MFLLFRFIFQVGIVKFEPHAQSVSLTKKKVSPTFSTSNDEMMTIKMMRLTLLTHHFEQFLIILLPRKYILYTVACTYFFGRYNVRTKVGILVFIFILLRFWNFG